MTLTDLVVERVDEAEIASDQILAAEARYVVLHGPADSGKTELVRRWIIPALEAAGGRDVWYADCRLLFPERAERQGTEARIDELVTQDCIVIVDSFGNVLNLPRSERNAALKDVLARFQAEDAHARLVLVVGSEEVTSLFALASMAPGIMSSVVELGGVDLSEGLAKLSAMEAGDGVSYSPALIQALTEDLVSHEEAGRGVNHDLVKVLHFQFHRLAGPSGEPMRVYEALGGLRGILRNYLEFRVQVLSGEDSDDVEIANGVLRQIAETMRASGAPDLAGLAPRLDVSSNRLRTVVDRLSGPEGLLTDAGEGRLYFRPSHLVGVIEEDLASRRPEAERVLQIVEEGLRSWEQLGNLLPPERFAEVQRLRKQLPLHDRQVQFLLRCALLHEAGESVTACEYWLRRVGSPGDGMSMLLHTSLDENIGVRMRAAALLREFPEPEVRSRLKLLALSDPDPAVRSQAVSSLEAMWTVDLMDELIQEVLDSESAYRPAAISALRIFRAPEATGVLKRIVSDPTTEMPLRSSAIEALGLQATTESIDALTDIALHDSDQEDREGAARALSSAESAELYRHLFSSLQPTASWTSVRVTAVLLGITLLVGAVLAHVFVLLSVLGGVAGLAILGAVLVAAIWLTREFLVASRDRSVGSRLRRGLAGAAFVVCSVTVFFWFHGLAHLLMSRRASALKLLALELLGIAIALAVYINWGAFAELGTVGQVRWIYVGVGLLLFLGTYLYDVLVVLFGTLVFADRVRSRARRAAIYPLVLGNSVAAQVAFDGLKSTSTREAKWAKRVLKRFGRRIDPQQLIELLKTSDETIEPLVTRSLVRARDDQAVGELVGLWGSADESLRRRIFRVLCRRPTQRSVDGLDQLQAHLGLIRKVRSWMAYVHLPLRAMPTPVTLGLLLFVPITGVLLYDGVRTLQDPWWPQAKLLHRQTTTMNAEEQRRRALTVEFLGEVYPEETAEELLHVLEEGEYATHPGVLAKLVTAVARQYYSGYSASTDNDSTELRDLLIGQMEGLAAALEVPEEAEDDFTFTAALEALQAMANVGDSARDLAIQDVESFVNTRSDKGTKRVADALTVLENLERDAGPRPLRIGHERAGHLEPNSPAFYGRRGEEWELEGRAGQRLSVMMESDAFDPYLFLSGPGLDLQRNDDGATGFNARIELTLPNDGAYTVVAAAFGEGSGLYQLTVEELPDLNTLPTNERTIALGDTILGQLGANEGAEVDGRSGQAWAFDGSAGQTVTIDLMSEDFDPYVYLLGPGFVQPRSDDDGGENRNSRLTVVLPESGTYRIIVSAYDGGTGAFTLSASPS